MDINNLTLEDKARMTPKEYRLIARSNVLPKEMESDHFCEGYLQDGPFMIPKEYAFEFLTFCFRNPRGLWVAEILDAGSPYTKILASDGDVRTDCNAYRVYKDGEIIDEPRDVLKYWRDDLVTFFLNCSYGFEGVLRNNNINFRLLGAFVTNIPANSAGCFRSDNIWVTCRAFETAQDAVRAIQVTSRLPISHGAPVHIGDPAAIGIKDILKPEDPCYVTPAELPRPNEVLLYWHCGLTAELAIQNAKLPFAMMMYPGAIFISDHLTEEFAYTEEVNPNLAIKVKNL